MSTVTPTAWDAERRAHGLLTRRERLLSRLPYRIEDAAKLTLDLRELIVDDAIEFSAVHYQPPVGSQVELERVFWDAASKRVRRAREGRYSLVRAGYQRADLSTLENLATGESVEDDAVARAELSAALQFAALLNPRERDVWKCKQTAPGEDELGAKRIAHELGAPLGEVLALERTIETKRQRFTVIYTAGRLCGYLAPAIAAIAAGDAEGAGRLEQAARLHLEVEKCPTCTADYTRHLRYLQSARFHGKVAALLPAPATQRPGRLRELLPDWAARLLAHDPANVATSGAGRGLGTAAAAKLASVCLAGGALGACVATGVISLPAEQPRPSRPVTTATPPPTRTSRREAPEPRLPHGGATPTATPARVTRRASTDHAASATTQGGHGSHSHEHTPTSPAPANAAAGGASEFNPNYQPSRTPAAPAPAAPGGSEFF